MEIIDNFNLQDTSMDNLHVRLNFNLRNEKGIKHNS
jgi:hypothetical protein